MSPTTTGATASGADAVVIPEEIETAINVYGAAKYNAGYAAERGGPDDPDGAMKAQDALKRLIAAALAAPAPVVPEEVRRAFAKATDSPLFVHDFADPRVSSAPSCQDVNLSFTTPDHITAAFMGNGEVGTIEQARNDAEAIAAAWNHVRALAATPSKPVGDGGEASAPPAGGGAVEEGADWAAILARSILAREGYAYDHLIDAVATELRRINAVGYTGGYEACHASQKVAVAPAAPEPAAGGEREIVRHLKRGTEYEVLGEAEAQVSVADPGHRKGIVRHIQDGDRITVYRGADNKLWCRFTDEFRDGRFETISAPSEAETAGGDFQARVQAFMRAVAGDDATDVPERRDRFAEEAMELTQALGADREAMHQLVDYVFGRPVGEPAAEMGGTAVTLAGLAAWTGLDMAACGEAELARCNTPAMIAKIRSKRSNRHGRGALPGTLPEPTPANAGAEGGQHADR